ncbi:unnamed protein product [Linum tenue]|uniref:Uncharacterized protein n=1 Tax=Linum tenue TaxID=586396 RepID=A0AAV0GZS0_9ROSI|nr:unnamed protein product [Linum tenue]
MIYPQADALEWLEANSNFHEEDEVRPTFESDEEPPQSSLVPRRIRLIRTPVRSVTVRQYDEEEIIVSKYISKIDGNFIPVTAPGGDNRVYAKLCAVEMEVASKQLNCKSQSGGLLIEPINVLFEKADQLAVNKDDAVLPQTGVVPGKIWVDKYAPNSFTELLSDEQTNREDLERLHLHMYRLNIVGTELSRMKIQSIMLVQVIDKIDGALGDGRGAVDVILKMVPMRLLSEKEKNDMDQLVSKMVSYSVTYKNARPNLHSTKPVQEAAADSSTLSFDPPITEFINFKGCAYAHNTLPLALKQVLVHEVEKRRILLVSKSTHDTEVCNEANLDLRERGNHKEPSSSVKHIGAFAANREKGKKGVSIPSSLAISSSVEASESSVSNAKLNSCEDTKKSSSSAANFFDRFRKVGSRGFLKAETVDCKVTTLERDSRPVLFKYNEGFTNAVKRPVKMREFLS